MPDLDDDDDFLTSDDIECPACASAGDLGGLTSCPACEAEGCTICMPAGHPCPECGKPIPGDDEG